MINSCFIFGKRVVGREDSDVNLKIKYSTVVKISAQSKKEKEMKKWDRKRERLKRVLCILLK